MRRGHGDDEENAEIVPPGDRQTSNRGVYAPWSVQIFDRKNICANLCDLFGSIDQIIRGRPGYPEFKLSIAFWGLLGKGFGPGHLLGLTEIG
jgi:hypothetical protein